MRACVCICVSVCERERERVKEIDIQTKINKVLVSYWVFRGRNFFPHVFLIYYEQQYNIILFYLGVTKKLTFEASVLFRWIQLVTGLKRKYQILFLLSHFFDTNKKTSVFWVVLRQMFRNNLKSVIILFTFFSWLYFFIIEKSKL